MVHLTEHANHPSMINTRNQDTQQINQKRRLLLEIKCESLVVSGFTVNIISYTTIISLHLHVGHSHNGLLELIVFPSICRTFNHGKGCIILGTVKLQGRQQTLQRTNSSYLMYRNTNSGHKWARSVALMTLGILMRATNSLRCSITAIHKNHAP